MAFDGITARAVVWELNGIIIEGRVSKVSQPEKDEIVLLIKKNSGSFRLLISANAENARVGLTEKVKENPMNAPAFCMALRKHLQGTQLTGIRQLENDRVIMFLFSGYNEMGDAVEKTLVAEVMGRRSNIVLLNEKNIIIDAIKHVDARTSSYREVMPARVYEGPPTQNKLTAEEWRNFSIPENCEKSISALLLDSFSGFSKPLCNRICEKAGADPAMCAKNADGEKISDALCEICDKIVLNNWSPCILNAENGYGDFHALSIFEGELYRFSSVSRCLEEFFAGRDEAAHRKNLVGAIQKAVNSAMERARRKQEIFAEDIRSSENYNEDELAGKLISANMYMLKGGEEKLRVINYYDENMPEVEIELDKNLTAAQNMQNKFKLYRKKKRRHEVATEGLQSIGREIEYLESVNYELGQVKESGDAGQIREELEQAGYIKPHKESMKKRPPVVKDEGFIREKAAGCNVWIGKNNLQNDRLSTHLAAPNDIWLHVKNGTGSHVILRVSEKGGEFTKEELEAAAGLAAEHSSLRQGDRAEVDFTRAKYVKKPHGARPGTVIYTNYKTIIVKK